MTSHSKIKIQSKLEVTARHCMLTFAEGHTDVLVEKGESKEDKVIIARQVLMRARDCDHFCGKSAFFYEDDTLSVTGLRVGGYSTTKECVLGACRSTPQVAGWCRVWE